MNVSNGWQRVCYIFRKAKEKSILIFSPRFADILCLCPDLHFSLQPHLPAPSKGQLSLTKLNSLADTPAWCYHEASHKISGAEAPCQPLRAETWGCPRASAPPNPELNLPFLAPNCGEKDESVSECPVRCQPRGQAHLITWQPEQMSTCQDQTGSWQLPQAWGWNSGIHCRKLLYEVAGPSSQHRSEARRRWVS
jgi:hypothetical protein